jgi:hypothetical protein
MKDYCKGLSPSTMYGDFEGALKVATESSWPACVYAGDKFHFMFANGKWWNMNARDIAYDAVRIKLNELVEATTETEFLLLLKQFTDFAGSIFPSYKKYFEGTWVKSHPPQTWAMCYRPRLNRSGDNEMEGNYSNKLPLIIKAFHRRIKSLLAAMESQIPMPLDRALDFLWKEFSFWMNLSGSKHHLESRKQ